MQYAIDLVKTEIFKIEKMRENLKSSVVRATGALEELELDEELKKESGDTAKTLREFVDSYAREDEELKNQIEELNLALFVLTREQIKEEEGGM